MINEHGDILSIVTPEIGDGPFNLVTESSVCFADHISSQSPVFNTAYQLTLGNFVIQTTDAKLWPPRPDWDILYDRRNDILDQLMSLSMQDYHAHGLEISFGMTEANLKSQIANFSSTIASADISNAVESTSKLAGLGLGLTPAGDDFILGAVLAARVVHPAGIAGVLAEEVTNAAAPLTTSLSAAWLRSAGKGEAGVAWRRFLNALLAGDPFQIQKALNRILAIGATSGADALAGFMGVFRSWQKLALNEVPDGIQIS